MSIEHQMKISLVPSNVTAIKDGLKTTKLQRDLWQGCCTERTQRDSHVTQRGVADLLDDFDALVEALKVAIKLANMGEIPAKTTLRRWNSLID